MYTHARRRVTITCVRGRLRARGLDLPLGGYGGEPMCFWTGCNCSEGWSASEKNRREGGICSSACAEASCSQGSGKAAEAAAESAGAAAPHTPIYTHYTHIYIYIYIHQSYIVTNLSNTIYDTHQGSIQAWYDDNAHWHRSGTKVSLCVISSFWNWNRPQNGPQSGGGCSFFS